MLFNQLVIFVCTICVTFASTADLLEEDVESQQYELIAHIINANYRPNGRQVKLLIGKFPNELYKQLDFGASVTTSATAVDDLEVEGLVKYLPYTVLVECAHFEQFEDSLHKAVRHPYWHPHANIIINYRDVNNEDVIPKMFYILWYYRACNAIILRYIMEKRTFLVSHYSPYISEGHMLQRQYGCKLVKSLGIPITGFAESFTCEKGCHNVSLLSSARAKKFGTCIGYSTVEIGLHDKEIVRNLSLFEDKGVNLHGYRMRAYASVVLPFTTVIDHGDGNYTLGSRDGIMWNTLAKLMNFTIDLSPVRKSIKSKFSFEMTIKQIFDFANRKADLFLIPVFMMELHVVDVDITHFMKESGICFVSHRAGFITLQFDLKGITNNYSLTIASLVCFFSLWLCLFLFSAAERGVSFDQAGKDFLNAMRNVLCVALQRPPKSLKFRCLVTLTLWGFFIVNFMSQASIISFFTVLKRGREVETFEDIIQRGYNVVGMTSPDVFLPVSEEKFRIINSRIVPAPDMVSCLNSLSHRSDLFCLVECSIARYYETNKLNSRGQQYLHTATDRVHNRYLTMLLQQHSPMTAQFNKYVSKLFEAGIIKKWEENRYNDIKEDVPLKGLSLEDLSGIFKIYGFMLVVSCVVFVGEVWIGFVSWARRGMRERVGKWKRARNVSKAMGLIERKLGKIKRVNIATQTNASEPY